MGCIGVAEAHVEGSGLIPGGDGMDLEAALGLHLGGAVADPGHHTIPSPATSLPMALASVAGTYEGAHKDSNDQGRLCRGGRSRTELSRSEIEDDALEDDERHSGRGVDRLHSGLTADDDRRSRLTAAGARRPVLRRTADCRPPRRVEGWQTARALRDGQRSAGEARCLRSHDARADKIGKVEGIEEGMTISVFVSKYARWRNADARREGRTKADVAQKFVHSLVFLVV